MAKSIAVIIPAAGFGRRMGADIAKQFINVGGRTILSHTVKQLQTWGQRYQHSMTIIVALSAGARLPDDVDDVLTCVGGETRADSVAHALQALDNVGEFDWAMVHDAARPLVDVADIEKLYDTLKDDNVGGILAEKIVATVKKAQHNAITETIPRDDLWLAQTPQMFRFSLLQQSLRGQRGGLTDEASGIEKMGLVPKIVEGNRNNIKITTTQDLRFFEHMVGEQQ